MFKRRDVRSLVRCLWSVMPRTQVCHQALRRTSELLLPALSELLLPALHGRDVEMSKCHVQCHVQTSVTITETDTWWNAAGCLQIGIIWYLYLYWYIAMICNVCTCIRQCTKIYDHECMTWRICEGLSEVLGALSSGSDGFLDKNKDQLSNAATSDHARFMRGWKLHLIPDFERHHTVLIILALHWAACSGRNIKNSTCFTKLIQL